MRVGIEDLDDDLVSKLDEQGFNDLIELVSIKDPSKFPDLVRSSEEDLYRLSVSENLSGDGVYCDVSPGELRHQVLLDIAVRAYDSDNNTNYIESEDFNDAASKVLSLYLYEEHYGPAMTAFSDYVGVTGLLLVRFLIKEHIMH